MGLPISGTPSSIEDDALKPPPFPASIRSGDDETIAQQRRRDVQQGPSAVTEKVEQSGWTFGPADAAIAAGLLVLALGISIPVAVRLNAASREMDQVSSACNTRIRIMNATARFTESRRQAVAAFRMEAKRYVEEVQAKPLMPWTAVATELSRARPEGVWITNLSANGARFQVQVAAVKPELAADYLAALQQSPVVEFATLPSGPAASGNTYQVVGRLAGE